MGIEVGSQKTEDGKRRKGLVTISFKIHLY